MSQLRTYTIMFVVLMVFSTTQALLEFTGLLGKYYWTIFAVIMVLSTIKAVVVAGWYQHLRYEPRAVSYLMATGVLAVIALTTAAAYSIL